MIFLSYWFWAFASAFFALYWLVTVSIARSCLLLAACIAFQLHFAGPAGVFPVILLGILTYVCGRIGGHTMTTLGIAASVLTLVFYKYLVFLAESGIGLVLPELGKSTALAVRGWLPEMAPLGISFFVFEFVHYLFEVRKGQVAIRSPMSFALFGLFWPSLVAGPIKRYQQFLPSLGKGLSRVASADVAIGILRVAFGVLKKFVADYLGQIIHYWQDHFAELSLGWRWGLLIAIALRILFDFSGYSDMAIGFAQMMGVRLPENFRWPYLATSPTEFWSRWHISLSTWIRDYVYIPLGGGRRGPLRRGVNALVAFALCGLWHGAAWNFALWGIYHGLGLIASLGIERCADRFPVLERNMAIRSVGAIVGWSSTMVFVMMGWLLFFYPLSTALDMARLLLSLP
jgi:alginate O-acetyltransferase complex protein AlgI